MLLTGCVSSLSAQQSFWKEDFSAGKLPDGWMIVDSTKSAKCEWIVTDQPYPGSFQFEQQAPPIASTSRGYHMQFRPGVVTGEEITKWNQREEYPNGYFTTCSYPNPEIFAALEQGLKLAKETGADLMLATDPDADRVGIAMKCPDGSYELVSGNEVGVLLLDYIAAGRIEKGTMPKNPVAVKSIVSTPLADAVAEHYGVELRSVLTGFKWIGDQIAQLEAAGEVDRFIFGFEESYGYLAGPYVRDKDAIIGSMLICEMAAYYRSIGSSLKQRLEEIYAQYGRYLNKVDSFEFPGLSGMDTMAGIMQKFRDNPPADLAGYKVVKVPDYKKPEETGLPAANVLIYKLENNETVVVRPSGTEPKIKIYYTTLGKDLAEAEAEKEKLAKALEPMMA